MTSGPVLRVEAHAALGALELDLAVTVEAGECLALAGPSGAGKTSALRIAAGLLRPNAGVVQAGDETWLDTERGIDVPAEERRCGYVFQEYALFPHLSAWQNVAYGLRKVPRKERRGRALELLDRFGLAGKADTRPRYLSGGERQRVAVARALAHEPGVLLLDEPLSALDARTRAGAARELALVLRETAAPTLLVTHDFAEAAQLGDRVGVIDAGRVVQEGTPTELAARPRSAFVADFTGAVVLTGTARGGPNGLTHVELDGGGSVTSTDVGSGEVAVSIYPWEIAIEPPGEVAQGSARNHLAAEIVSITTVGNRVRLGLVGPQPLAAEITLASAEQLALEPGTCVTASWKAAATRLVAT
ncbi:MAG TPA: ABC transporter ATP-binding protein [Thermoleophilaceae bacterium]|nr:ABC transporter ATP-binding protein [Thermoleophilaceae bacterium]